MSERKEKPAEVYKDLFVYLIHGVVKENDEALLGEAYIGNWVEESTSFLFFRQPSREMVLDLLMKRAELKLLEEHQFTYEEWQGGAQESIRAENLLIVPPWKKPGKGEGEITILLDPGVVFGTGLHPTTRDCLAAMHYLRANTPFRSALDLGTGTGILSLAAAFLGAEKVLAVDLNPLCVKTALRNVSLNGLEGVVKVLQGDAAAFLSERVDLILANVHYDLLMRLLELDDFRQKKWLVLSGLMRSQARDIEAQLSGYGLKWQRSWEHEGTWYTILVKGSA